LRRAKASPGLRLANLQPRFFSSPNNFNGPNAERNRRSTAKLALTVFAPMTSIGGDMLVNLLTCLHASPAHYRIGAWMTFCRCASTALLAAACGREKAWWQHPVLFSLAILIVLLAFRWPELLDNRQYPDPDESQFIAGASTMREGPIFWRSVDGTTHGPLTEWPLLIALGARGSLDFATARTVSILLLWLGL